jgi:hypothetical protein
MIYRFSCSDPKDMKILEYLRTLATEKQSKFKEIFPWVQSCQGNPEMVCFIALSFLHHSTELLASSSVSSNKLYPMESVSFPIVKRLSKTFLQRYPPNICGWLNALVGVDYLYITKVTTRTPLRPSYGGIGKALFMKVFEYGREIQKDYVELFPANEHVAMIYQKWGFIHLEEVDKKNLYYLLNPNARPTPPALIDMSDRNELYYTHLLRYLPKDESKELEEHYKKNMERVLHTIEFLFEEANEQLKSTGSSMASSDKLTAREKRVLKMIMTDILKAL